MSPNRFAFTLVFGLFTLILGTFTVLKGGRSLVDAWNDANSLWVAGTTLISGAPLWASALIVVGAINLLALLIWPWLSHHIALRFQGAHPQGSVGSGPAQPSRMPHSEPADHLLVVTSAVECVPGTSNLEWHVTLNASGTRTIQHGDVAIRAVLDGKTALNQTGKHSMVRPGFGGTYRFPFPTDYSKRDGEIVIDVETDYGFAGAPASRHLSHKMRVPFRHRGIVAFSTCHTEQSTETQL